MIIKIEGKGKTGSIIQYPQEGASLASIFFHPRSQSPRPNNREGRVEEGSLVDWNADKKIREAD